METSNRPSPKEVLAQEAGERVDNLEWTINQYGGEALEIERQTDLTSHFLAYTDALYLHTPEYKFLDQINLYGRPTTIILRKSLTQLIRGQAAETVTLDPGRTESYMPRYQLFTVANTDKPPLSGERVVPLVIEPEGEHLTVDRMDKIVGILERKVDGTLVPQEAHDWVVSRESIGSDLESIKSGEKGYNNILKSQIRAAAVSLEAQARINKNTYIPHVLKTFDSRGGKIFLSLKTGEVTSDIQTEKIDYTDITRDLVYQMRAFLGRVSPNPF